MSEANRKRTTISYNKGSNQGGFKSGKPSTGGRTGKPATGGYAGRTGKSETSGGYAGRTERSETSSGYAGRTERSETSGGYAGKSGKSGGSGGFGTKTGRSETSGGYAGRTGRSETSGGYAGRTGRPETSGGYAGRTGRPETSGGYAGRTGRPESSGGYAGRTGRPETSGGYAGRTGRPESSGGYAGRTERSETSGGYAGRTGRPETSGGYVGRTGRPETTGGYAGRTGRPETSGGFAGRTGRPETSGGYVGRTERSETSGGYAGRTGRPETTGGYAGRTGRPETSGGYAGRSGRPETSGGYAGRTERSETSGGYEGRTSASGSTEKSGKAGYAGKASYAGKTGYAGKTSYAGKTGYAGKAGYADKSEFADKADANRGYESKKDNTYDSDKSSNDRSKSFKPSSDRQEGNKPSAESDTRGNSSSSQIPLKRRDRVKASRGNQGADSKGNKGTDSGRNLGTDSRRDQGSDQGSNQGSEKKSDSRGSYNRERDRVHIAQGACPYSRECGGCRILQQSYEADLKDKQKMVDGLFKKFCHVEQIIGMEQPNYYRNKVNVVFDHDKKGNPISGVYEEGSHRVVPIENCLIHNQKADAIIASIRGMLKSFKIKTYDVDSDYGLLRNVLIKTGFVSGEIMVVLVISSTILPSKNNFVKALLAQHPEITTIVVNVNDKKTSMVLGNKEQVIYGKGFIEDTLCGKVFRISPKSFYQVNPAQAEVLYKKAIDMAGLTGTETVVDAYCGIGTIGLIASDRANKVIGVELNKDAVRDANINAKRNEVKNIEFYKNDAGEFMSQMAMQKEVVDVVFMDPPKTGSNEQFMDALALLKPKKVVYISCNPITLERDLEYLTKKGFNVDKAVPVDMFPWTGHVETVVLMSRK